MSLNVTVTDGGKTFVRDLDRGDFAVFEDGVKQELTYFTKAQLPIALSLLVDTSASMEDKIKTAQEAASGFVKRLRPNDLGQVIDFDNRVTILQNFTSDQESARRRHPPHRRQRIDVAAQRDLHLAEGTEEGPRQGHRGRAPAGDRRALRR